MSAGKYRSAAADRQDEPVQPGVQTVVICTVFVLRQSAYPPIAGSARTEHTHGRDPTSPGRATQNAAASLDFRRSRVIELTSVPAPVDPRSASLRRAGA